MFFSRGKNKVQNPYTMPDFYKDYIKQVEINSGYDVDYNMFKNLCEEFYKEIMEYIFKGGLYILPYNLGEIAIVGKRVKVLNSNTMPIDWKKTNELGKKVYHFNDHSNYYKYRFRWSKLYRFFKNRSEYRLVFTRHNKRRLANIIKNGEYNYFDND